MPSTATQTTLFERRPLPGSIEDRFERWCKTPEGETTISAFIDLALELQQAGRSRYGGKAIIEKLRHHSKISVGADGFKLNNNWTSRLVRLAMEREPRLKGFFSTRELQ